MRHYYKVRKYNETTNSFTLANDEENREVEAASLKHLIDNDCPESFVGEEISVSYLREKVAEAVGAKIEYHY